MAAAEVRYKGNTNEAEPLVEGAGWQLRGMTCRKAVQGVQTVSRVSVPESRSVMLAGWAMPALGTQAQHSAFCGSGSQTV